MSRPLRPGLVAEGDSDCLFLMPLIDRQLRELLSKADCDLFEVTQSPCVKQHGADRFHAAAIRLARECHLVFVHADHNEAREAEKLAGQLRDDASAVVVVPKRETEAWLLADPRAFRRIRGACLDMLPEDVEKEPDPKGVLKQVVLSTGMDGPSDFFARVGRDIDLTVLGKVPAFAAWLERTTMALKGMRYL